MQSTTEVIVNDLTDFFNKVITTYKTVAPESTKAYQVLDPDFKRIDHIAFRTFDSEKFSLQKLERWFLERGYQQTGCYSFSDKHVRAKSYSHPHYPRIFISELIVAELSPHIQNIIYSLLVADQSNNIPWCSNPHRQLTKPEIDDLMKESEYAAWVALNGLNPNHLTVAVDERISSVIDILERKGFQIATFGGKVKGSQNLNLEQGSTVADIVDYETFDGQTVKVASSYCEFAKRWNGFDAFVDANANRIFESTDVRPIQRALAIVKPDGVHRGLTSKLLTMLLDEGLEIVNLQKTRPDRGYVELLYAAHKGRDYFEGQIDFMTSGEIVLIELHGTDCAMRLRSVVKQARQQYATSIRENVIHGSDSVEAGEYEVGIFFGRWQINKS